MKLRLPIHSVKYNFLMNVILKMSTVIFPLITFPYISRVLGAAGNGKISFAASVISYFTMFASLGIPTYGVKVCAQCRDNKEKLSKTVHELLIISLCTTIIVYVVLIVSILCVSKLRQDFFVLIITSFSIILTTIGIEWFYQAIEQYGYITYRNLFFKVLSIVLMFMFVKKNSDYLIYAGVNVIGSVGSNILNLIRIKKFIFIRKLDNYNIKRHIYPILSFFMLSIAATVYNYLDTIMLGFMTDDAVVGYYTAAIKVKTVLVSIVTALGTVLLPRIAYYVEKGMQEEFEKIIKKSFQFILLIALPLTFYFIMEAKDSILLLAGEDYYNAISPMMIIMPTILFIGLSNITGIQILVPIGKEKYTILSTVIGAIIDLVLNALTIPRYGAAGAAFGTLIAEFSVLICQIIILKDSIFKIVNIRNSLKIILAVIIASVITLVIRIHMNCIPFINLLITAVVFWGIYMVTLVIFKEIILYGEMDRFICKMKNRSKDF